MDEKVVSKSEFAEIAGVTASAVTKACRGVLKASMVGTRVDANHSSALEYLEIHKNSRLQKSEKPHVRGHAAKKEKAKSESRDDNMPSEVPENIQQFVEMPLGEIIHKFGTDTRFVDWLKATQIIEVIEEKRLKNAVTHGKLVSRERIKAGVIDQVNAAHQKLLTDGARTIARRATAMHGAKRDLADIEKFVSDQIASFIKPMKAKVSKALKEESCIKSRMLE